jgi:hypothetical protein
MEWLGAKGNESESPSFNDVWAADFESLNYEPSAERSGACCDAGLGVQDANVRAVDIRSRLGSQRAANCACRDTLGLGNDCQSPKERPRDCALNPTRCHPGFRG